MQVRELSINPVAKPRMTRSSTWAFSNYYNGRVDKVPSRILRYLNYVEELKILMGDVEIPGKIDMLVFHIPIPKSWSKKKKLTMTGKPHQSRPDIDNLQKAFFDALCKEDSHIWSVFSEKYWGVKGKIIVKF